MRKTITAMMLATVLTMTIASNAKAQSTEVTLDPTQITVSVLPLMAHLEAKVGEKQSVTVGGGLIFTYYQEEVFGETSWEPFSTTFLTASFRNYYDRKRVNKDNLRNNSGNYYGIYSYYTFDTILSEGDVTLETDLNSFTLGPVWGFQRNYASGIHLDLSLGIGYQFVEEFTDQNGFTLIGGFEFGFRFNK